MAFDQNKPQTPVIFTEMERVENNKKTGQLTQAFLMKHVEITARANSDLENMIHDGKQMYCSLAVQFAVEWIAAEKKRSGQ